MNPRAISAVIVGAGRGERRLDNTRGVPASLQLIEPRQTVLDWTLHALDTVGVVDRTYVGGYHIEKVVERYPALSFRFHARWQSEGELAALVLATPPEAAGSLVVRASTICLPEAIERLLEVEADIAAGTITAPGEAPAAAGVIMVSANANGQAFDLAARLSRSDPEAGLDEWLAALADEGAHVALTDLGTTIAPVDDPEAVARTVFGGKGRTLERVRPLVRSAVVLDQVRFRTDEWKADPEGVVTRIRVAFPDGLLIVRSSADVEDGLEESAAGQFASVLDVPSRDDGALREAVDCVAESLAPGREGDEVLVQPQVDDLAASGVVLTRDLESGAAYYVVSLDRVSGRSGSVTAGGGPVRTYYVARSAELSRLPHDVAAAVEVARELEVLTHMDALDVELAIDRAGTRYLFQVRPLPRRARTLELADEDLDEEIERVREFLETHLQPHPTLAGRTTLFGDMPDWNPAELIGTTPRPLALSLYQRLIGDRAWARARAAIGYRDVQPEPLIVSLAGRPYVDVRASLNSFLPADLAEATAERWVNACTDRLARHSELHDKLEFEVAVTCLAFDFPDCAGRLIAGGLGDQEIEQFRSSLLALTDAVLTRRRAPIEAQVAALEELSRRRERWLATPAGSVPARARRLAALLADAHDYGTEPFSILARYAFMALTFLKSLARLGVLGGDGYDRLLAAIPTVASEFSRDLALASAQGVQDALIERYGHLRPSSYDIVSPNYASAWAMYIGNGDRPVPEAAYPDVNLARSILDDRRDEIADLLASNGFTASPEQLRDFVVESIPAREWAKFEFTKSLDAALEEIAAIGAELGFTRDDISFLPVEPMLRAATDSPSAAVGMEFRRLIEFNKKRWTLTRASRLPHLIRSVDDVTAFELEEWSPNFVTSKRVTGEPALIEGPGSVGPLAGRIVLIRAADPGYDWIFSHGIAGLVTEFGGAASHMAIRAAEFGLPAAIGCGEVLFNRLLHGRLIDLDCASKRVGVLS